MALPDHSAPPPALRLVGAQGPAPFSWKVLGNLSKVFPLAALGSRLGEPTPPTRTPRRPTAQPAVLGRSRFREGLGHRGQKIRLFAPPCPPGPPPAPSRRVRDATSQSRPAACAPREPALRARSAPTGSFQPPPSGRASAPEQQLPLPGHGPLRSGVSAALCPNPAPRRDAAENWPRASHRVLRGSEKDLGSVITKKGDNIVTTSTGTVGTETGGQLATGETPGGLSLGSGWRRWALQAAPPPRRGSLAQPFWIGSALPWPAGPITYCDHGLALAPFCPAIHSPASGSQLGSSWETNLRSLLLPRLAPAK